MLMEQVALWMMGNGYGTGHGDTVEDMLEELVLQVSRRAETDGYNKGVRDMAQCCPVCREAALPFPEKDKYHGRLGSDARA